MWYAVVEEASGRLHSVATVLAEEMPDKYVVIPLGEDFDPAGKEWDASNLVFVQERFGERLISPILAKPGMQRLTDSEKRGVRLALESLLRGELP